MTKLRRITALLLVIVMAVSLFGITALADHRPGGGEDANWGFAYYLGQEYMKNSKQSGLYDDPVGYGFQGKITSLTLVDDNNVTWTFKWSSAANGEWRITGTGVSEATAKAKPVFDNGFYTATTNSGSTYSVVLFKDESGWNYESEKDHHVNVFYYINFIRAYMVNVYLEDPTGKIEYDGKSYVKDGDARTGSFTFYYPPASLIGDSEHTQAEYKAPITLKASDYVSAELKGYSLNKATDSSGNDVTSTGVTISLFGANELNVYCTLIDYTVTYRYDSSAPEGAPAIPARLTGKHVSDVIAVADDPSMENYTFEGWAITTPESGTTISDGKFSMPAADVVITGSWTENTPPTPPTPDPTYTTSYSWTVPEGKTLPDGVNRPNDGSGYADEAAAIASKDTTYKENSVVYDSLGKWTFSGWTNGKTANYNVPFTGVWSFEDATVTEDTASFKVVKVDGSDAALAGATFTLTKTGDPAGVTPVAAGAGKNEFTFDKLTEGTYTLTESAPKGYKAVGPWTVTVEKGNVTVTGPTEDTNNVIQKAWNWIVSAVTGNSKNLISSEGVLTVKNEKQTELPVRFYVEIVKNGGTSLPEYSFTDAFANLPTSSGYAWLNTTNSGKTAADYDAITTSIGTDYETDAGKIKTWLGSADANITIDNILALVDSNGVTADTTINGVKLSDISADKDKYEVVYSALQKNDDAINSWISGNLQSDGKQHSFHVHVIVKEKAVAPVQTYEYTIHHVELKNENNVLAPDTTGVAELGATIVVADAKKTIDDYTYDSNSGNITITDGTNEATIYYTKNSTPPTPPTTPTTYYYQIVNHYTATVDGVKVVDDAKAGDVEHTESTSVNVPTNATSYDKGAYSYTYAYVSGGGAGQVVSSTDASNPTVFNVFYSYTYDTPVAPPAPPVDPQPTYYNVTVNWIGYDENGVEAFRDTQGPTSYLAGSAYDLSAEAVKTYDDYSNRGYEMTGASGLRGNVNGDIVLNVYYDAQTNIPTPEPPLVDDPDPTPPTTDIPDDDPALDDTPKTGDSPMSLVFWLLFCMSGCGLVVMAMTAPRKRSER